MGSSAASLMKEMQKIASNATIKVQELANQATEKSFKYNKEEAATARAWQEEMSNTSHQREVKDLQKAGLNPVLSANSGAQSYTTSSASAQANDASSSVGSLAGDLISSRTNAYAADTSAAATRAAAAQSAAATKAAAAQAAGAQRYAAYMAWQTKKDEYQWKIDYMKEEYKQKLNQPVGNWAGLIDKYLHKSGVEDTFLGSTGLKKVLGVYKNLINKSPIQNFKDLTKRFNSPYAALNQKNQDRINSTLNRLNVPINRRTRNLLTDAMFNGKRNSWNTFVSFIPKKKKSAEKVAKEFNNLGHSGHSLMR